MSQQLIPDSIISGNAALKTYKKDGLHLGVSPVKEYIVIVINWLPANENKYVPLSSSGLSLRLISAWFDAQDLSNLNLTVTILQGTNPIQKFTLPSAAVPYRFPDVILTPELDIQLKASKTLDKLLIYAEEVVVKERLVFL